MAHATEPVLAPPRKLSEELADLNAHFAERPITLREVIVVLGGRAYDLLLILLALPFVTPIPLPGLSTPFGLAIAIIALRLVSGQKPWLPERILQRELPAGFFAKVLAIAARIIRFLESLLRPRWATLFATSRLLRLHALLIFVSAFVLLLPLPIPFTNAFPAWAILCLAGGLLERDGLAVTLGYVVFAAGTLYFALLGEATDHLLKAVLHWWGT